MTEKNSGFVAEGGLLPVARNLTAAGKPAGPVEDVIGRFQGEQMPPHVREAEQFLRGLGPGEHETPLGDLELMDVRYECGGGCETLSVGEVKYAEPASGVSVADDRDLVCVHCGEFVTEAEVPLDVDMTDGDAVHALLESGLVDLLGELNNQLRVLLELAHGLPERSEEVRGSAGALFTITVEELAVFADRVRMVASAPCRKCEGRGTVPFRRGTGFDAEITDEPCPAPQHADPLILVTARHREALALVDLLYDGLRRLSGQSGKKHKGKALNPKNWKRASRRKRVLAVLLTRFNGAMHMLLSASGEDAMQAKQREIATAQLRSEVERI